jgi:branched-chain amino acid transport system permease protein
MNKISDRSNSLYLISFLGVAFLSAPLFLESQYYMGTLIMMLVNTAMAVSLRMVLISGQFHVCHAAFMGIGAYSTALMVKEAGMSFWVAFPAASGITALVGLIIGSISLRLKGLYFFFVTLCLGEMFRLAIANGPRILGGYTGITIEPTRAVEMLGLVKFDLASKTFSYYFLLFLTVVIVTVAYRIDVTRYGKIAKGLKQNDVLLESLGVGAMYYKLQSFVICCAVAGLMGSFWSQYFLVVALEDYGIWASIYFLVYNQVGGLGSVAGPIVGAISLTILREGLRSAQEFEPIVLGVILIVSFYFIPKGLVSLSEPGLIVVEKVLSIIKRG